MRPVFFLVLWVLSSAGSVQAARVIMKDGKTFEGRIVAETDGDVLLKTSPVDRPKLLPNEAILTVIRDPVPVVPRDPQRYVALGTRLIGNVRSSQNIAINPSPSVALDAGFRFHPVIELGASMEWSPVLSGELGVTDGTVSRSYESFFSYGGGLWTRLYPLYAYKLRVEPFLIFGYRWSNLVPRASDDVLKGGGMDGGAGVQWPWRKNLYAQAGFLYHHDTYGVIEFMNREGSIDPRIRSDSYAFFFGLSWHVL